MSSRILLLLTLSCSLLSSHDEVAFEELEDCVSHAEGDT